MFKQYLVNRSLMIEIETENIISSYVLYLSET